MNKDGGPAFPVQEQMQSGSAGDGGWLSPGQSGMSLRDYFAGQALHGFCALAGFNYDNVEFAAQKCYALADAMLKAREAVE